MRQIEEKMIAAIRAGKPASIGNTTVSWIPSARGAHVHLHGNLIGVVGSEGVRFTLAGWPTPTTRSRINALLREFAPGCYVSQHAHEQRFGRAVGGFERITATEWVTA